MITKMTKYSFILLSGDKQSFLDRLQALGVVDITRSEKPVDEFSKTLLGKIDKAKADIKSIREVSDAHLTALGAERNALAQEVSGLAPWGDYDMKRLAALGVKYYCVNKKQFHEEWADSYALQVVSEADNNIWFVIVGDADGFPLKEIAAPAKTLGEAETGLKAKEEEIAAYRTQLDARKVEIPSLENNINDMVADLNIYLAGITGEVAADDALIVFEGFASEEDDAKLKLAFDGMDIYYQTEAAGVEDNPPIKLKNNRFSRQFEVLTSMYGMPVYNEFDPTIFLSIFFLLFFAICMGDAGYGILLVIIGLCLRGKEGGLAKMWTLIVTLGIGTFFVGLVMGSFFGIDLMAATWIPSWMKSCMITGDITVGDSTYAKQMIMALVIGVLHISLALTLKAVWTVRKNGFRNSLSAIGWTLLFVGGIIGLSIGLTGVISEAAMKWLLIGIGSVSALGIFIFNKWGRNPLVNIGSGLWDTYSMASGLMGDVLSYIRLYALGLSGGLLGATFNQIAEMVRGVDPTWQWVPSIVILILGHTLNLAMSCLAAFVHPLRLNFVEFFKNSGYEGRGLLYNPLKK